MRTKCCWIKILSILQTGSTLIQKYMDICFSHSLRQLIVEPTKTTERIKNTCRLHFSKLFRKVYSEWCYWNRTIWPSANLLYKKGFTFEVVTTRQNINKVNEKLLKRNFCGRIKINKTSRLLKLYMCKQNLSVLWYEIIICNEFCHTS